jgi:hypothetical protein
LAYTSNAAILRAVQALTVKVGLMSDQQAEIAADVTAIQAGVQALTVADTAIQAEIAALKAANPQLDLTALDAAAKALTPAVASITALAPPAA